MAKTGDSNKTGTTIDELSPYYIGSSDNPGHVFVTDVLSDGNYGDCSEEMSNCLFAKNKFGFIDESIPMPEEGSSEFPLWKRCNAMVKGWLIVAMDKEICNSVKHAKTAREIWNDLEERFGNESAPKAYKLKRNLTLTRQDKMSVSAYYTKLKSIWDEIESVSAIPKCTCGKCTCNVSKLFVERTEKERIYEFLMGLDDVFNTIKTQIISTKPMPSLGMAYHLVAEDERQRMISASRKPVVDGVAFQVQRHGNREHRDGNRDNPPRCANCGKLWHTIDTCYEIVGYPEGKKGNKVGKTKEGGKGFEKQSVPKAAHVDASPSINPSLLPGFTMEQLSQLRDLLNNNIGSTSKVFSEPAVNMAGKIDFNTPWVIDYGATEHITHDEGIIKSLINANIETPVKIPNGDKIHVRCVGNVDLPNGLSVERVLHVPDFQCNLLSVSRLTKDLNCVLTFFPDFCTMQDLASRNLIGVGRQCDGLYLLEPVDDDRKSFSAVVDPEIWHRCWGINCPDLFGMNI